MLAGVAADADAGVAEARPTRPPPAPPPPSPPPSGWAKAGAKPGAPGNKAVVAVATIVAVILVVGAIAVIAGAGDDEPGGVEYTELKVGDCFERPPETLVRAERVDCGKPHDLEVFATPDDPAVRGAPYPGRDILEREAAVVCLPQFEGYVGKPFDQSSLVFVSYVPTKGTWDDHDRRLLCTVSARENQQLQGPAKGSQL